MGRLNEFGYSAKCQSVRKLRPSSPIGIAIALLTGSSTGSSQYLSLNKLASESSSSAEPTMTMSYEARRASIARFRQSFCANSTFMQAGSRAVSILRVVAGVVLRRIRDPYSPRATVCFACACCVRCHAHYVRSMPLPGAATVPRQREHGEHGEHAVPQTCHR